LGKDYDRGRDEGLEALAANARLVDLLTGRRGRLSTWTAR